jgi:peptide deformylase
MAVLRVLKEHNTEDNKILRTPSNLVDTSVPGLVKMHALFQDMLDTMNSEQGIGIAAVQVGVLLEALIVDIPIEKYDGEVIRNPYFIINPAIIEVSEKKIILPEGCLSARGKNGVEYIRGEVERPESITIQYTDISGNAQKLSVDGSKSRWDMWRSRCLQHEMAHLRGELFTDYLVTPVNQRVVDIETL